MAKLYGWKATNLEVFSPCVLAYYNMYYRDLYGRLGSRVTINHIDSCYTCRVVYNTSSLPIEIEAAAYYIGVNSCREGQVAPSGLFKAGYTVIGIPANRVGLIAVEGMS